MKITKNEYDQELASLKYFGITDEEYEDMLQFFEITLEVDPPKGKIRMLNTGRKKR